MHKAITKFEIHLKAGGWSNIQPKIRLPLAATKPAPQFSGWMHTKYTDY